MTWIVYVVEYDVTSATLTIVIVFTPTCNSTWIGPDCSVNGIPLIDILDPEWVALGENVINWTEPATDDVYESWDGLNDGDKVPADKPILDKDETVAIK